MCSVVRLNSLVMLHGLLVDAQILDRHLAERIGLLHILLVLHLNCLLVVRLCHLPGNSAPKVSIQRIYFYENLFQILGLILASLTLEQKSEQRKVLGTLRDKNF